MRWIISSLLLAVSFLAAGPSSAQSQFDPYEEITGLTMVLEGDLLSVNGTIVRLYGVDAPELGQFCETRDGRPYDCGLAAKNVLTRLLNGRDASCTLFAALPSTNRSGVCQIEGVDLGGVMVLKGWAFSYRGLSNRYEPHEARAQATGQGVWSGRAQRPWVWRQEQAELRSAS